MRLGIQSNFKVVLSCGFGVKGLRKLSGIILYVARLHASSRKQANRGLELKLASKKTDSISGVESGQAYRQSAKLYNEVVLRLEYYG